LRLGTALFSFWETREYLTEGRDRLAKSSSWKEWWRQPKREGERFLLRAF